MLVVPSLDIENGRSRLVWWPGASTGGGAPTDRPERIAETFVRLGAAMIHLVDQQGAAAGRPVNTGAIGAVARAVAVPLQVAGGIDGPEQIELAFAAGATRVVMPLWAVAEERETLRACVRIAGDWLAVGLDARQERLRDYPWRTRPAPTLEALVGELAAEGVRRFVLSHGGSEPDTALLAGLCAQVEAEVVVAGGIGSLDTLRAVRDAGVGAVILGEALFTGAVDLEAALAVARDGT